MAGIGNGSITAVGSGVDADGAWCHLRDSDDIGKLSRREPVVGLHRLVLNQRKHTITSAKAEEANLKESDK